MRTKLLLPVDMCVADDICLIGEERCYLCIGRTKSFYVERWNTIIGTIVCL